MADPRTTSRREPRGCEGILCTRQSQYTGLGVVNYFSQDINELRRKEPLGKRVRDQHCDILGGRYRTAEENGHINERGVPATGPRRK
jgi:hypothetical protein